VAVLPSWQRAPGGRLSAGDPGRAYAGRGKRLKEVAARERRAGDTRARILEVAEREFAASGYAGAHLQHIASQIGVQKTALYYYFENKAALYEAVLLEMLETFDARVSDALEARTDHAERMRRLLDALNDLLVERPHYARILFRLFVDRAPMRPESVGPHIEALVGRILAFHREGVDAGAFVKRSSRQVFQTLLGALIFHYASDGFGAAVVGVDDLFSPEAAAWRREEAGSFLLRAMLREPDRD
jgi:AcrR family transcriptional regulator